MIFDPLKSHQRSTAGVSLVDSPRFRAALGFTLIELLVVLTLLALLLTIAVPRYLNTTETARHKVRAQNMATLRDALDKFKADQGRYPAELVELVHKQYLRALPYDPVSESNFWKPVAHPKGEPGVYDISPPGSDADAQKQSTAGQDPN